MKKYDKRQIYQEPLSQSGYRFVEKLLYDIKTKDTVILELENELKEVLSKVFVTIGASAPDGMPRSGNISNPTEEVAIKTADNLQVKYLYRRIDEIKRHTAAVEKAMEYMTDTEKQLIKLKYYKEKPSKQCWQEMHIEKSRWYEIRKDIIRKIAYYLGVI